VFDGLDDEGRRSVQAIARGWQERLGLNVFLITPVDIPAGLPLAGTIRATVTVVQAS